MSIGRKEPLGILCNASSSRSFRDVVDNHVIAEWPNWERRLLHIPSDEIARTEKILFWFASFERCLEYKISDFCR